MYANGKNIIFEHQKIHTLAYGQNKKCNSDQCQ